MYKGVSLCFNLYFPDSFRCWAAFWASIHISFLVKSVQIFCPVLGLLVLLLNYGRSWYILDTSPVSDIYFVNIFLACSLPIHFLNGVFWLTEVDFFILIKCNSPNLIFWLLLSGPNKPLPPNYEDTLLYFSPRSISVLALIFYIWSTSHFYILCEVEVKIFLNMDIQLYQHYLLKRPSIGLPWDLYKEIK